MAKNYLQLELGGKTRGLKFNIGALKIIHEVTGGDPFSYFVGGSLEDQIKHLTTVIFAGLTSNCRIKKEDPDFTQEDVLLWVEDLTVEESKMVGEAFQRAYTISGSGEAADDTQ